MSGCTVCLKYCLELVSCTLAPEADGYILTSPVSDRELVAAMMDPELLRESIHAAREVVDIGWGCGIMPLRLRPGIFANVPFSASRWVSIADKE